MPVSKQEVARGIGAVDLETFVGATEPRRQPHVVEHGAGIKQFGIELQIPMLARQCPEVIDAAGVVEQQWGFGISHQLGDLARQLAVGDCHAFDFR
jgi:hypothetical protein